MCFFWTYPCASKVVSTEEIEPPALVLGMRFLDGIDKGIDFRLCGSARDMGFWTELIEVLGCFFRVAFEQEPARRLRGKRHEEQHEYGGDQLHRGGDHPAFCRRLGRVRPRHACAPEIPKSRDEHDGACEEASRRCWRDLGAVCWHGVFD